MPFGAAAAFAGGSALLGELTKDKPQGAQVVDTTPEEFRRLRGSVAGSLEGLLEGGGPRAPGPFVAGLTEGEQDLLGRTREQAKPSQASQMATQQLSNTLGGDFLSPESNPFLQGTIKAAQRPVIEEFENQVMPRLRSKFTQAGQFIQPEGSSPFDQAAAEAVGGLTRELGDISSEIAGQNFQAERGRQMQASQLAPQIDRAQLDQLVKGMEAQALPRMIQQMGIDRGLEEFRRRMDVLLSSIQTAGGLASPSTTTLPGSQPQPSPFSSLASGFAAGMGSGGFGGG